MIVIVDYDMGNVGSIKNMIKKVGGEAIISRDKDELENASKLILPGVGAFDTGMKNLHNYEIFPIISRKVLDKKIPVLGVCLGMQLLTNKSEEGNEKGLGWIDGKSKKFPNDMMYNDTHLRVPHMGWNTVTLEKEDKLFQGSEEVPRFYFVHSYYVTCDNKEDVLTTTNYGMSFTSSVSKDNIWGVQYHPEKSHKHGMNIYHNFVHTI